MRLPVLDLPPPLALLLLSTSLLAAAPVQADDAAEHEATAHCVAVMEPRAEALAHRVKGGDKALEPTLRTELERAAALLGRSYLDGMQDEAEAKARLKKAQDEQAGWPEARRERLYQDCVKQADAELAQASAPQRYLVERVARNRMRRMLGS